jgi:hypothetical protein
MWRTPGDRVDARRSKFGRGGWAQPQVQEWIHERSKPRATSPAYEAMRPLSTTIGTAERTALNEASASLQAQYWPYSMGSANLSGKVVHSQAPPHLFSNRTSTTTRYSTDAPHLLYTGSALGAADTSGRKHAWHGTSLAHQRYQYHVMLSHVPLKMEAQEHEEEKKFDWTEASECTGGGKTDTLLPGEILQSQISPILYTN